MKISSVPNSQDRKRNPYSKSVLGGCLWRISYLMRHDSVYMSHPCLLIYMTNHSQFYLAVHNQSNTRIFATSLQTLFCGLYQ